MKTIPTLEATVLRMKTEIQADQATGIVPQQVKSFSELHDYVDANEYGGFCEEGRDILSEESVAFANAAQNQINEWLADNHAATVERREGERRKQIDEHARHHILKR